MEKNSIVGGELMDIANGNCGWLGRSDRVVRRIGEQAFFALQRIAGAGRLGDAQV